MRLCLDDGTEHKLTDLANAAGRAAGGAWSIDLLETRRGWMVTDMAEAANSWHDLAGLSEQIRAHVKLTPPTGPRDCSGISVELREFLPSNF